MNILQSWSILPGDGQVIVLLLPKPLFHNEITIHLLSLNVEESDCNLHHFLFQYQNKLYSDSFLLDSTLFQRRKKLGRME